MEYISIIISVLALGFSAYTYITHDLKIKKQEKILNDYQINEIENKKTESKKAIIEANTVKVNAGQNIIKIYNKGQSMARNVNMILNNSENEIILSRNPFPIDIKPQHSVEILIFLTTGCPDKIKIGFEWEDNYKEKNIEYQYIQIL